MCSETRTYPDIMGAWVLACACCGWCGGLGVCVLKLAPAPTLWSLMLCNLIVLRLSKFSKLTFRCPSVFRHVPVFWLF